MRITRNKSLIRKLLDKLARDVMYDGNELENLKTAQQLVNVLEEEAQYKC